VPWAVVSNCSEGERAVAGARERERERERERGKERGGDDTTNQYCLNYMYK